ncbi:MAG TPA: hypothetical protein VFN56_02800 [Candidatus Saccharimonadales bacterium]|nr:hypothetical protein [Candidatus Saccharimonadales bacterium]
MSQIATHGQQARTYDTEYESEHVSGWTGWVGFAAVMMVVTGVLHIINGFVGLYRSSFYLVTDNSSHLLVFSNVRAWAWFNLIAGIIVTLAGISLFSGRMWARIVAVILAVVAIAVNLLAITLYPVWSIIAIALSILVIYAVTVHAGELSHD